ncbi:transporter substrate-binding domain-containing protein [Neiella marina]|uniref:Transporter substrate-binding domain-containing protein n=1 Tax=Neiella holothuriorum TaxID=2870530 RepID=A0ABS7EBZ5_9GAMM|nr:transporter substrate-binding domain-containing protein [Neiella holothuriorum]MBW8189857.1 transporter substrate-binding domain-containing protein [Neiella holothuriorum]
MLSKTLKRIASQLFTLAGLLLASQFPALAFTSAPEETPTPAPAITSGQTIKVATRHAPPFSIKTDAGWQGITIELVKRVATNSNVTVEFEEMSIEQMLAASKTNEVHAAAAALTITAERERDVDFTHPYLTSGLGIAVAQSEQVSMLSAMKRFFSGDFLKAVGALLLVLSVIGILVWLAERGRNEQFSEKPVRGIGAGLWWSAVTMTTVGYGDKAPQTTGGRFIALIWMFASIIIISGFTAAIATSLTVNQLGQSIAGLDDLYNKRVLTVAQSTSADLLTEKLIRHKTVASVEEALALLAKGETAAVVYDLPILQYMAANQFNEDVRVLPNILVRQDYGIALPPGTTARESINQEILTVIAEPEWNNVLEGYLGRTQ